MPLWDKMSQFMGNVGHKTLQDKLLQRDGMSQERLALLQGD